MHDTQKLYIVTRRDLAPGMQVAQSVHAAFEFASVYGDTTAYWMDKSNNICVLAVDNELALVHYYVSAKVLNLKVVDFYEPDIGNELTAIAIEPCEESERLVSGLDLALKV